MMRTVTIYGVTSHEAHAGSFVEMYRMPPLDSFFPIAGGDELMAEPELIQRLQLKRHTIRRIGHADEYIAIEPELEALLMLPIKARLTEAEAYAERQERDAKMLLEHIAAFNALPWYLRLWIALRREV